MADECCDQVPEQQLDHFDPREGLLYSELSATLPNHALIGSATGMRNRHLKDHRDHGDTPGETKMVQLRQSRSGYVNSVGPDADLDLFDIPTAIEDTAELYVTNLSVPMDLPPSYSPKLNGSKQM